MSSYTAIPLDRLPAPEIIEQPDFETLFLKRKARLIELAPHLADALELESDGLVQALQEDTYRELLLRAAVNDVGKGNLLAFAKGALLDHLGAFFGVQRQVVQEADDTQDPKIKEILEDDERFRRRIQLAPEGYTTCGTEGSYTFWSLTASPLVEDVAVIENVPAGQVRLVVLSNDGNGTPGAAILDAVDQMTRDRRPLTDEVLIEPATIIDYSVEAVLTIYDGPDAEIVRQAAVSAVEKLVKNRHAMGHDITIAALHAALVQEGVQDAQVISPAASIVVEDNEAAHCSSISITIGGRGV